MAKGLINSLRAALMKHDIHSYVTSYMDIDVGVGEIRTRGRSEDAETYQYQSFWYLDIVNAGASTGMYQSIC